MLSIIGVICITGCVNKTKNETKLISYKMNVAYAENQIVGTQTTTICNYYKEGLDKLCFNLYPNAYREDAKFPSFDKAMESYGGIEIETVMLNDKDKLQFAVNDDKNLLIVNISPLKLEESISIYMTYTLTLPICNLRMGITDNNIKLASFYPQLAYFENGEFRNDPFTTIGDPFLSECADYDITISAPSDYIIASSGTLINSNKEGDNQIVNLTASNIRDFAIVMDKNYQVTDSIWQNKVIKYYHYGDENVDKTMKIITDSMAVYSDMYGMYDYPTLSVVVTDFVDGGMEFGRLVYISSNDSDLETTIAHEIAHQWWYSMVGSDSIMTPFIDEGMATFSSMLYYKSIYGDEAFESKLNAVCDSYSLYEKLQKMRQTGVSLELNKSIYDYTDYQYQMLVYQKSAMMFGHIYQTMGKEKFKKGMSNYVKKYKYKMGNIDNMIEELNDAYGQDIGGVVKGWQNACCYYVN